LTSFRNELWDHESARSINAKSGYLESRALSMFTANSRGVSPAASYNDLKGFSSRPASNVGGYRASGGDIEGLARMPYGGGQLMGGSPRESVFYLNPYDTGRAGERQGSLYGDDRSVAGSFYGQPALIHRQSSYTIGMDAGSAPIPDRAQGRPLTDLGPASGPDHPTLISQSYLSHQQTSTQGHHTPTRGVSSYFPPQVAHSMTSNPATRLPSSFIPDPTFSGPLSLGADGISDAQLEVSIRNICAIADLDQLTKKGVRRELEIEYHVGAGGLAARKDIIGRLIERVLAE
jgi:chitin synthase